MNRRRGHGEGHIRKREDGRWEACLDLGWVDGKRKSKAFYGRTRNQVARKLREAQDAHDAGVPFGDDRLRLGDYLEHWIEHSLPINRKPATVENYRRLLQRHIIPTVGHVPLAKLQPEHVENMLVTKRDEGLSARTVQLLHAILRVTLNHAVRRGRIQRNVSTLVDVPTPERKRARFLDVDQVHALLNTADGKLLPICLVAVGCGLRRGEILALEWADVDLDAATIRVERTMDRIAGELVVTTPKTASARRTLAIPAVVVDALRAHRAAQLEERIRAANVWQDHGLVFPSAVGTHWDPRNLNREFSRLCDRAGIERVRFHDLRHTAASLQLMNGESPKVVQDTLGHSQFGFTMTTYAHVMEDLKRDAADRMDQTLRGPVVGR